MGRELRKVRFAATSFDGLALLGHRLVPTVQDVLQVFVPAEPERLAIALAEVLGGRTRRLGLAGTIHASGIDRKRNARASGACAPPDGDRDRDDRIEAFCRKCESLQYVISNWRETLWADRHVIPRRGAF